MLCVSSDTGLISAPVDFHCSGVAKGSLGASERTVDGVEGWVWGASSAAEAKRALQDISNVTANHEKMGLFITKFLSLG
jgi:hypothetical protein